MTKTPAAVLFDLDGTLVDSEALHRAAIRLWLAGRGWPSDDAMVHTFTGQRAGDVLANVAGPWTGLDPDPLVAELMSHYPEMATPPAMPGAVALTRAAAAAAPIGLVTSAAPRWAAACLGSSLSDAAAFAVLVTAADITNGKPAPDCYLLACQRLEVDPGQAWVVEDAPAGVAAAVAAGIGRVFVIASTFSADLLTEAGAHRVVTSLDEIAAELASTH